jgi:hypothetical protein
MIQSLLIANRGEIACRIIRTALVLLLSISASAYAASRQSKLFDGQRHWVVSFNSNGAVVSAGSYRIYLGKNCDAFSKRFGRGVWGQANGGVAIQFEGRRFGFPRQHIDILNAECDTP